MAFVAKNFERIAGGVKKLYHYNATADAIATVTGADYFGDVRDELDTGDVIMVIGSNNTTFDNIFVTSARSAASVTTSGVEGVTAT